MRDDIGPLLCDPGSRGFLDIVCDGLPIELQREPGRIRILLSCISATVANPAIPGSRNGVGTYLIRTSHALLALNRVHVSVGDEKVPVLVHDWTGIAEARSLPLRPAGTDVEKRPSGNALAIGSQGSICESQLRIGAAVEFH